MDEKRLEILELASQVYMKYGVKSVTMDDLAREMGMSKKTIYQHFKDKNDLVKSIIELKISMDQALCRNSTHQSENAIDDMINFSRIVVENVGNINPTVFFDLQKYHKDAMSVLEKHKYDFVLNMMKENIKRGIAEGLYREDIDEDVVARIYVNNTDLIMNSDAFPWPEFGFERLFMEMVRYHINGVANEKGKSYLEKRLNNETL